MNEEAPDVVSIPVVVGIGASAGGVEALSDLLSQLPITAGMAFLVVLHLDRTHASHLAEILAKHTTMAVAEATHGAAIEADKVYVITPDRTLDLEGSQLVVGQRPQQPGPHMPVDHLFAAIARERGDTGIGIVLSGTGTDGSLGVTEIKAAGGITFAQDAASAKFDGMPESAVESGASISSSLRARSRPSWRASPAAPVPSTAATVRSPRVTRSGSACFACCAPCRGSTSRTTSARPSAGASRDAWPCGG